MKKKHLTRLLFLSMGFGLVYVTCQNGKQSVNLEDGPHQKLSQYNFFEGVMSDLEPNEQVVPYDLNSPLFSDYAYKARFIWMPEGSSANYTTEKTLEFPDKTILIKNFFYLNDERDPTEGRNIIETRLLINQNDQWNAHTYIWNEEQTDANLEVIGGIQEISWTDKAGQTQTINYIIPNKNQCKSCHLDGKELIPIGPKARNLNKLYSYAEGSANQLVKWSSIGYLRGFDLDIETPKSAVWNDPTSGTLHQRALSYLDINCGHCHNPSGSANTSGLHLVSGSKTDISLGIYKATVSAGAGTGGHTYSIVPGKPQESIMIYRMNSTNPAAMMPELGRSMVHVEGVELISEWIEKLTVDSNHTQSSSLQ